MAANSRGDRDGDKGFERIIYSEVSRAEFEDLQDVVDGKQPLDPTLTALAGLDGDPGILVETAPDTFVKRQVQAGSPAVVISNSGGVAGNIVVDVDETQFSGIPAQAIVNIDHNSQTTGIQGGIDGERYHITSDQLRDVNAIMHAAAGVWHLPTYTKDTTTITLNNDGIVVFHENADGSDQPKKYAVTGGTYSLTPGIVNWIYADYNNGSPVAYQSTSWFSFDYIQRIPIYLITLSDGEITVLDADEPAKAFGSKQMRRKSATQRIEKEMGGLNISESPGRIINCTDGAVWVMYQRNVLPITDSTIHTYKYEMVGGSWVHSLTTQYNNMYYTDGINTATLNPNKYAITWIYRNISNGSEDMDILYGRASYNSLAEAVLETIPVDIPGELSQTHILVGRIICLRGASTASLIESAFPATFTGQTVINDHNALYDLQGGTDTERFHLDLQHYDAVMSPAITGLSSLNSTGLMTQLGSGTFVDRIIQPGSTAVTVTNGNGASGNPTIDVDETQFSGIPAAAIVGLGTLPLDHNTQLSGLQGGDYPDELYHMTKAQTDSMDSFNSAGRLWGGKLSLSGTPGVINIAAGAGVVKRISSDLETVPNYLGDGQASDVDLVTWGATQVTLAGVGYNLIVWDASAGGFVAILKENFYSMFDFTRDFGIGRVYYDGVNTTLRLCGINLWNFARRIQIFGEERFPVERATGMLISATTGLGFAITAGRIWAELVNPFSVNAFNTATGTFTYWYRNGSGGWTSIASQNAINNTQYDNGTGALGTLTAQRYGVHWVYEVHDSSIHVVFGQGDYTLSDATAATAPTTLPGIVSSYATLVGRIIVQKSAASLYSVQTPFTATFQTGAIANHNDLSGIQGGTTNEYYHLTASQNSTAASQNIAGLAVLDGTPGFISETAYGTFAKRALTAGSGISISYGSGITANPIIGVNTSTLSGIPQNAIVGLDTTQYVKRVGDETIAGVKTFSSSPVVPTPTTNFQAATKKYVDDNAGGVTDPTLLALKDLDATPGIVTQTATDTFTKRSLSSATSALVITNPAGVAGNFILDIEEYGFSGIQPSAIVGISDGFVDITSNQTVNGRKTFTTSPRVPTPVNDLDAVNKVFLNSVTGPDSTILAQINPANFTTYQTNTTLYNGNSAVNWPPTNGSSSTSKYQVLSNNWVYVQVEIPWAGNNTQFSTAMMYNPPFSAASSYIISNISDASSHVAQDASPPFTTFALYPHFKTGLFTSTSMGPNASAIHFTYKYTQTGGAHVDNIFAASAPLSFSSGTHVRFSFCYIKA